MYDFLDKIGLKAVLEAIKGKIPTVSNPNLLINPDFRINQRGFVSASLPQWTYTVDRWCTDNIGSTISITSNGLKVQNTNSRGYSTISQPIEHLDAGGYTITICVSEYTDATSCAVRIHGDNTDEIIETICTSTGTFSTTFNLTNACDNVYIEIYATGTGSYSFTLKWVKLEIGSAATPFVPPEPASELLKCQRYYFALIGDETTVINSAVGIAASNAWIPLGFLFPTEMRAVPTILISYLAKWNTAATNENTICEPQYTTKKGVANLRSANKEFVAGTAYYLRFSADAEI